MEAVSGPVVSYDAFSSDGNSASFTDQAMGDRELPYQTTQADQPVGQPVTVEPRKVTGTPYGLFD
jgi:hypothetical protein